MLRKAKTAVYTLKEGKKRENIEKIKAKQITNVKKLNFSVLVKTILCS
ncbi:MAG: hypothetical protein LBF97_04020 [Elusimicrobiota bacterium]|nr:hypothetical protein [Elusimicrobiota bacterium]